MFYNNFTIIFFFSYKTDDEDEDDEECNNEVNNLIENKCETKENENKNSFQIQDVNEDLIDKATAVENGINLKENEVTITEGNVCSTDHGKFVSLIYKFRILQVN